MSIKLFVMDVDGTLTDGHIYVSDRGELMKAFYVRDGYAIAHKLPAAGIIPVIITGRESDIVKLRAAELGVAEVHQNVSDKLGKLREIAKKYAVKPEEIAYIGDDENDLECIDYCGFTACPSDAQNSIKAVVNFVSTAPGGHGAVRDFAEKVLRRNQN